MMPDRSAKYIARLEVFLLLGIIAAMAGCGGSSAMSGSQTPPASSADPCTPPPASLASPSGLPAIQEEHVFVVMEENHSYDAVMGNTQDMPFLNSLANAYSYASGYYANAHPSLPNYFMITTGQTVTTEDTYAGTVSGENVEQALTAAGKTWKAYIECLPSAGYLGGDTGCYLKHHNPFAYFADLQNDAAEAQNIVPFTQLAVDMASFNLPNYAFIVPDPEDDGHDCPGGTTSCTQAQIMSQVDTWLQTNIGPLLQDPDFNSTGHGLLIITFDEAYGSDTRMGGGKVPWVAVGPDVKKGYTSAVCFQEQSTLRFMLELLGVTNYPGAAATGPSMRNFLVGD